jgi:hypothetical protein
VANRIVIVLDIVLDIEHGFLFGTAASGTRRDNDRHRSRTHGRRSGREVDSGAQVLEHLFLTYHNTNKGLDKCLEKGTPLGTRATLRHRLGTLLIVNLTYFPPGRKTPERAAPKGMPADEVRRAILLEIQRMDAELSPD